MKEEKTPEEIQLELNQWLEKVHDFGSIRQFYYLEKSIRSAQRFLDPGPFKAYCWPEDYNIDELGTKSDSDVFFKKINSSADDINDLLILKKYLTDDELKERLDWWNYIYIQTDELADRYIRTQKQKELDREIAKHLQKIEELKEQMAGDDYVKHRLICTTVGDDGRFVSGFFNNHEAKLIAEQHFKTIEEQDAFVESVKSARNKS